MEQTGVVIVAAGLASRMGALKPALALGESTVLGTLVSAFLQAGAGQVVVVTGRDAPVVEKLLKNSGAVCLHNPHYATSDMFASAKLGLEYMVQAGVQRVFFTPADVPLVQVQSLRTLLAHAAATGAGVVMPTHLGSLGHPVLLVAQALPVLLAYAGPGGLRGAIDAWPGQKATLEVADPGVLLDIDTPGDYTLARLLVGDTEDCPLPGNIRRHQCAVANVALALGAALNETGHTIDLPALELAALVHDVYRGRPHHAQAAADALAAAGKHQLADIVRQHMWPDEENHTVLNEATLLFLADKLVLEDEVVGLKARYAARTAGQNTPAVQQAALQNRQLATALYAQVEVALGTAPDVAWLKSKMPGGEGESALK